MQNVRFIYKTRSLFLQLLIHVSTTILCDEHRYKKVEFHKICIPEDTHLGDINVNMHTVDIVIETKCSNCQQKGELM